MKLTSTFMMQFNNLPFSRANWTTNWTALARQWSIVSNWKSRKSRAKSNSSWERLSELSRIDTGKSQTSCSSVCDRETRSRNLIDNVHEKLAQTNKKLIDVKRVCTEATKHCLKVQLENVRWRLLVFLCKHRPHWRPNCKIYCETFFSLSHRLLLSV